MYMLELPSNFSTSEHRSRDISAEAIFPIVQRAKPTMYMLAWFRSLEDEESMKKTHKGMGRVSEFVFRDVGYADLSKRVKLKMNALLTRFGCVLCLLLERVGQKGQDLLVLIQKQHGTKVAQTLVREQGTGSQLQTFDLTKVGRVTKHMDVKQLRDVRVAKLGVFLFE